MASSSRGILQSHWILLLTVSIFTYITPFEKSFCMMVMCLNYDYFLIL